MTFYERAASVSGLFYLLPVWCKDCDEEITDNTPVFYEADGDVNEEGHAYDCSTYVCEPCGVDRGYGGLR